MITSSANRFPVDSLLVFRASGLATVAATTGSTTVLALDQLSAYWNAGENANLMEFAIECQIESITAATGTPTVTFSAQVDTDPAFSSPSPVTIDTAEVQAAAGWSSLAITKEKLLNALAALGVTSTGAVYLQAVMTLAGGSTTPAVAWNAYASPLLG